MVVSSEEYQKKTGHVTLLMVTSAKHSHWDGDHAIKVLKSTGLPAPSIVRQKLFTIDGQLIERKIGKLSKEDCKEILRHLHQHLPF